jgi:6-phosphogluconolactonase (cycloisomerase 2 family)
VLFPLLIGTVGTVAASNAVGAVYTMTNSSAGNKIQVYDRASDGKLTMGGSFSTGGKGSGTGLGSQGAIVLSKGNNWLFAVNAGSNEISVFSVKSNSLKLIDKISSHGSDPISLTFSKPYLYVLNAGNNGGIAGFRVDSDGHLSFLQGSVRPLSSHSGTLSPEEIGFTPDGEHLVVSEKGSNLIDTYALEEGMAHGPVANTSAGPAPYGFGFTPHGVLVISEAANSAASTYKFGDKRLKVISASVLDTQAAACWLVVSADGSLAYAANAGSGTLSAYGVSDGGKLTLLSAVAGNTGAGSHPIDMDFSSHDQFLYALSSGNSMINAFAVNDDGSLSLIASFSSPAGASGLAAR